MEHSWNVTPRQAIEIQKALQKKVKLQPLGQVIRTVAGADISFNPGAHEAYAVFVVIDIKTHAQLDQSSYAGPLQFPYIPGLLSFREIPLLMEAWKRLKIRPDLVMIDGHGIAHPRRLGIASHFGVLSGVPTIGCAKSKLVGSYEEPATQAKSHSDLIHKGELVGFVYRTRKNVSPIFISPGHLISLSDTLRVLDSLETAYRIPEPTRRAHIFANNVRREWPRSKAIFHSGSKAS